MENETKICKYCKTEIPKKAKVCPNCRKKQGGIVKWIVIGVIALIVIVAATSGDDEPTKVDNPQKQEESANNSNETTVKKDTFSVGETAELHDIQVTLTQYKETNGSEWNRPADGKVFLLAEFEIVNNSDDDLTVSSMLSFEAYADDYALEYSLSAMIDNENAQLDGSVGAGKKMKGWIGYEVPSDYKNVEIQFVDNVWSDNPFKFVITK